MKAKYHIESNELRSYNKLSSCIFKRNNEEFGALSNMATGFPLRVSGIDIKTTEALYQACRFPNLPEIQKKIIEEKSPMVVKMISDSNKKKSREDWNDIRLKVMKWCIQVKLAQNFVSFGAVLHQTGLRNIVENSSKDNFWGAIPNEDGTVFIGKNALGRLLMDLRQSFYSKDNFSLLYVAPPTIPNFLLYNESIDVIDERKSFIDWLQEYWKHSSKNGPNVSFLIDTKKPEPVTYLTTGSKMNVEEEQPNEKAKKPRTKGQKGKKRGVSDSQPDLFPNSDNNK